MQILVFKTNLSGQRRIRELGRSLDEHPHIEKWNVDWYDRDRILRVVSPRVESNDIINLVKKAGFHCEEL